MNAKRTITVAVGGVLAVALACMVGAQGRKEVLPAQAQGQSVADLVTTARAAAALEPVAAKTLPAFMPQPSGPPGTYWLLGSQTPPLPFNPFPELEVYPLGDNVFLVDDRAVDYAGLAARQAAEAEALRAFEGALGLAAAGKDEPALAGADGEANPPPGYGPTGYGSGDLWLELVALTNGTGQFCIHSPEADGVYDLFATTNLALHAAGLNLTNWLWVGRCAPGQSNLTVTNLVAEQSYFVLGRTNDTDGGGFSDAFERLVTHTDPANPADDRQTPLVGVTLLDAVASEQTPADTARFAVSRLGGAMGQPLTVALGLSGPATPATDYALSPATVDGTNVWITLAAGQAEAVLTLTAVNDAQAEGTETATLALRSDPAWEVDGARVSATAWILELYSKTFTVNADFAAGLTMGLEAANDRLQFRTNLPPQFPFINVACSGRGTVARINTTNGQVVGEYRTTPERLQYTGDSGQGPQPSRTTVDLFGNVWVANRADDRAAGGRTNGSITRIGLIMGGTRHSQSNGVYYPDPNGQYVSLSDALYNTCLDRDGDGFIRTSRGLADILPWDNLDGEDSAGGVSSAEDEAITEYVRVPCTGTRTLAVDKWNDIWVGGSDGKQTHLKVNGLIAAPVPDSAFDANAGGYGGAIDRLGHLWSATSGVDISGGGRTVWLRQPAARPPTANDWQVLTATGTSTYGIAVDPLHPYVWQTTGGGDIFRWHTNGTRVTNTDGSIRLHNHGSTGSQGLAVDANGHVWVAHGKESRSTTVGHLNTNGTWLGNVTLRLPRLRAEYFANTHLAGPPALIRADAPIDFDWGAGSPDPTLVPTNDFSARWSGVVEAQTDDHHEFFVTPTPERASG